MTDYRTLRMMIRKIILEALEEQDEEVYPNTAMPDEEVDAEDGKVIGGPDLGLQQRRDDYVDSKEKKRVKTTKVKLRSHEETDEDMGDEHAMVGFTGPVGQVGNGPGEKPFQRLNPLKPKDAMRPLDEYDE